jgi:homoserine kinase
VANVSVGFDLMGHSLGVAGDRVRVERVDTPAPGQEVEIVALTGLDLPLPKDAESNTAGAAILAFRRLHSIPFGFRVHIHKGIPLGSGMGGSAACAVAGVVAANALLESPLEREALYASALAGEAVASGSVHGDNVAPQLLGGLVLAFPDRILRLPVPWDLHCALVHPHQVLETRRSRAVLVDPYPLARFVEQSFCLARVLGACFSGDLELLRGAIRDVLVEPRRAPLIPGFPEAKAAALDAGALGAGISGGGPSVFAWCLGAEQAERVRDRMVEAFRAVGVESDGWVGPVSGPSAEVMACG